MDYGRRTTGWHWPLLLLCATLAGCATPKYAVRATPVPEESVEALQIERAISAVQAQGFERQGARPIQGGERLWGFDVQSTLERLSRVTERPQLAYRAYLYQDRDPNAAALADGRIYLSNGMLNYLAGRGSREEELAVIISHEIAHTVAQHLVKRYRWLQQQGLLMTLVAAGASAVTGDAGSSARELGRLALDVVSMLQDVANSGYSQDQELEADQLGIRYVMRAGYDPRAALDLLSDFSRFENPWPFLRTHPYMAQRREDLARYLTDIGALGGTAQPVGPSARNEREERVQRLREAQKLYPVGSQSWKNLQEQIDELEYQR
ncbi:MAG: M48 family metalloprotease [Candidatus Omnitrophica bacterium]|nr:M48 family metalloprotease [Candidatus Omnitrophota bacterium]